MSTKEFIQNKITTDTELNIMQKNVMSATVSRAFEAIEEQQSLLSDIRNALYQGERYMIDEVTPIDDRYVIFKATLRKDNEEYYRTYDRASNKILSEVSYSVHEQILITLGHHYEGGNSRFAGYASSMLGIDYSNK